MLRTRGAQPPLSIRIHVVLLRHKFRSTILLILQWLISLVVNCSLWLVESVQYPSM